MSRGARIARRDAICGTRGTRHDGCRHASHRRTVVRLADRYAGADRGICIATFRRHVGDRSRHAVAALLSADRWPDDDSRHRDRPVVSRGEPTSTNRSCIVDGAGCCNLRMGISRRCARIRRTVLRDRSACACRSRSDRYTDGSGTSLRCRVPRLCAAARVGRLRFDGFHCERIECTRLDSRMLDTFRHADISSHAA